MPFRYCSDTENNDIPSTKAGERERETRTQHRVDDDVDSINCCTVVVLLQYLVGDNSHATVVRPSKMGHLCIKSKERTKLK